LFPLPIKRADAETVLVLLGIPAVIKLKPDERYRAVSMVDFDLSCSEVSDLFVGELDGFGE
jgi:hypothetical protein